MPYPNEHAARIISPDKYEKFARKEISAGIDAILGIKEGKSEIQAYRFAKEKFTPEEAKKWLKEHKANYINFEPASDNEKELTEDYAHVKEFSETFDLDDKTVFKTGAWKGWTFTKEHLDNIVKAFNSVARNIPLKLGHKSQKFIQEEGHPAAGWVKSLKVEGDRLIASFRDIPKLVKECIDKKAYDTFSCEIAEDFMDNGKKYPTFLSGIALLGADLPAVSGISDFAKLYSEGELKYKRLECFNLNEEGTDMAEAKELEAKISTLEGELKKAADSIKKFSEDVVAKDKEIADIKAKEVTEKDKAEIKTFCESMVKEFKMLPAQIPVVSTILENLSSEKKIELSENGKTEKFSARDMYQNLIKTGEKVVDPKEKTMSAEEKLKTFSEKPAETHGSVNSQKLDFLAKEFAESKKVSYEVALIEISKQNPELCK